MPRTIRDAKLESRAARARLTPGNKAYWKTLEPGRLHLGYRRKVKDQPGLWLARHYKGGERYQVAPLGLADDFSEAGDVLSFAEAQRAAHDHKWAVVHHRSVTVAHAIAEYVAWLKVHRATGDDAAGRAAKHILPELGAIKLSALTTAQINRWLHQLGGEHRATRATANRVLTILKAAANKAFAAGQVSDDTAWRRVKPFEGVNAARPGFLTLPEATRLINAASGEFRDLVQAALLTGARYGELRALRCRDFHRGKIAIHRSKSGKPRDIVLNANGVEFFTALTTGRSPDQFMLLRAGQPWQRSEQTRPMKAACDTANIAPPIGFHQLRHSYASHAVTNGMPLLVLARNLGHASTVMVERHYGHLLQSYIDEQIRAAAPDFGIVRPTNVRALR
jgi:integrase